MNKTLEQIRDRIVLAARREIDKTPYNYVLAIYSDDDVLIAATSGDPGEVSAICHEVVEAIKEDKDFLKKKPS